MAAADLEISACRPGACPTELHDDVMALAVRRAASAVQLLLHAHGLGAPALRILLRCVEQLLCSGPLHVPRRPPDGGR